MVKTASTMLPLGTYAPDFALQDMISDDFIKLSEYTANSKATLIIFMCNHCPYVIHIIDQLIKLTQSYEHKPLSIIAINSNDPEQYPDDSPEKMKEFAKKHHFHFPYLFDSTQEVARSYEAACTPDFFLFNQNMELIYRGQFDDSRPGGQITVTGEDLKHAIDCVLTHQVNEKPQKASLGCNIKWK
ncbi:MAG TPA: thioredoxin family protein [Legionellales bacterium]|nr:thioredoxin family protein [Legionellales bacterium]